MQLPLGWGSMHFQPISLVLSSSGLLSYTVYKCCRIVSMSMSPLCPRISCGFVFAQCCTNFTASLILAFPATYMSPLETFALMRFVICRYNPPPLSCGRGQIRYHSHCGITVALDSSEP